MTWWKSGNNPPAFAAKRPGVFVTASFHCSSETGTIFFTGAKTGFIPLWV